MKLKSLRQIGWIDLPVSVSGALIALAALALCVQVFVAVDRHSPFASDTLDGVFPFFVCTFLWLDWVADRSSHR